MGEQEGKPRKHPPRLNRKNRGDGTIFGEGEANNRKKDPSQRGIPGTWGILSARRNKNEGEKGKVGKGNNHRGRRYFAKATLGA